MEDILKVMSDKYNDDLDDFNSIEMSAEEHHDDPHIKRALRVLAWMELNESGARHERLWLKKVLYKFKKDEIAKPRKKPRSIGDLGVAASLQGFIVTKLMKKAQEAHPCLINGGKIEFVSSPKTRRLQEVFDNLLNPPGRFYMAYFSDDSCFSFRHFGKIYTYNLDISSCDASHGTMLFAALLRVTPPPLRAAMKVLIEQCELDITVRSCHGKEKIRGHFSGPVLFSGSTLTTVINNLANMLIGIVLSRVTLEERDYTDEELSDVFTVALEGIGYIVTGFGVGERCSRPEDIQFLKHSPVKDVTGVYRPVLNPGVLLRSSGSCHGDLPGRKSECIFQRIKSMQYSLLCGMYPRVRCPFIDNMKTASLPDSLNTRSFHQAQAKVSKDLQYKVDHDEDEPVYTFTDEAMFIRYDLNPLDHEDLTTFSHAGATTHSCAQFADKVLKADYGLRTLSWKEACKSRGTWSAPSA
jgi:hypothetical protein